MIGVVLELVKYQGVEEFRFRTVDPNELQNTLIPTMNGVGMVYMCCKPENLEDTKQMLKAYYIRYTVTLETRLAKMRELVDATI